MFVNWPKAVEWLEKPAGAAPGDLLRFAWSKCKVRTVKPRIRLPGGKKAKPKLTPLPKLKKELDRVFSIFIRQRDSVHNMHGMANCVTCGYFARWQDMDAGHYVPRQDLPTRWDEKNVHIQCKKCNGFRGGEPEKMAEYINRKYGLLTAIALRTNAKDKFRLNRQWLEMKIRVYKAHIGEPHTLG